jgi:hypothetical protein
MCHCFNRKVFLVGVTLGLGAIATFPTRGADSGPEDVLKEHDLSLVHGSTWVLGDESAIQKAFKDAQSLGARWKKGEQQRREIESSGDDPKMMAEALRAQAAMLGQEANALGQGMQQMGGGRYGGRGMSYYRNMINQQRNEIAQEQRRLNTMVNELNKQGPQYQKQKLQFSAEVERLHTSYDEAVDALRTSVDKAMSKYTELAESESVEKALASLSTSTKTKQQLGPSKDLLNVSKWLGGSGTVRTETVELRRANGFDHIDVQLAGRSPISMALDVDAPQTLLPAALATKLGLRPTGRTVECEIAGGTKVTAKAVMASTVRVGRLTAKEVECAAVPDDKGEVAPRLGQSFLQHFQYKYLKDAGRLILTRTEPDEPATKPASKASAKTKPSGRHSKLSVKGK